MRQEDLNQRTWGGREGEWRRRKRRRWGLRGIPVILSGRVVKPMMLTAPAGKMREVGESKQREELEVVTVNQTGPFSRTLYCSRYNGW